MNVHIYDRMVIGQIRDDRRALTPRWP